MGCLAFDPVNRHVCEYICPEKEWATFCKKVARVMGVTHGLQSVGEVQDD